MRAPPPLSISCRRQSSSCNSTIPHPTVSRRQPPKRADLPTMTQEEDEFFARFERNLALRNAGQSVPTRPLGGQVPRRGLREATSRRRPRQQWLSWPLILLAIIIAMLGLAVVFPMQDPHVTRDDDGQGLRREEFHLLPDLNIMGLLCQCSNLQHYMERSDQHSSPSPVSRSGLEHLASELQRLSTFEDRLHAAFRGIVRQRDEATQKLRRFQSATNGGRQGWVPWRLWRHAGPLWTLPKTFETTRSKARRDHVRLSDDPSAAAVLFDGVANSFCQPLHQAYSYELYGRNPTLRLEQRRALELAQGLCLIADAGLKGWRECNNGPERQALGRPRYTFPRGSAPDTLERLLGELGAGANNARSAASCGLICSCLIGVYCMFY
ncbi:hypothetical protein CHU98_g9393 [Xylaria longipes]|nr:hypothetical protein CHU98_g9393 [Xylaria longipes]